MNYLQTMNGMNSIKYKRESYLGVVVPPGGQLSVRRFWEIRLYGRHTPM